MTSLVKTTNFDFVKETEKITVALNITPDPKWLQKTPDGKADYIPIGIIEKELRQDFAGLVQFEVISERRELNEYICVARIKIFHPVIGQWMNYDGIGAVQITQSKQEDGVDEKGNKKFRTPELSEFNETKVKNALKLNAPNAYAEAIKNAAKKIGKKYGADINRKFEDVYEPINTLNEVMEEVLPLLKNVKSIDDLMLIWESYPDLHTSNRFKFEFSKVKSSLTKAK